MILRKLLLASLVSTLPFALTGCDESSDDSSDTGTNTGADTGSGGGDSDAGSSTDGGGSSVDYPAGPYGTSAGDVIANLEFTTGDGGTITLGDIRARSGATVLFLNTAAGWCGACIEEQPKIEELFGRYSDDGLQVVVSYFEDDQFNPAEPADASAWKEAYGLSFDVVADIPFVLADYYDESQTPMNMVVDLSTMEIQYISTGEDIDTVEALIQSF